MRLVLFLWFGGSMRRDRHAAILLPVVVVGAATAGGALTERVALLVRPAGCSSNNSVTSLVIALNAVYGKFSKFAERNVQFSFKTVNQQTLYSFKTAINARSVLVQVTSTRVELDCTRTIHACTRTAWNVLVPDCDLKASCVLPCTCTGM